jgi:hypothetical protein
VVSTAGFSAVNTDISWREAKTSRLFSQCRQFVARRGWGCWVLLETLFCRS